MEKYKIIQKDDPVRPILCVFSSSDGSILLPSWLEYLQEMYPGEWKNKGGDPETYLQKYVQEEEDKARKWLQKLFSDADAVTIGTVLYNQIPRTFFRVHKVFHMRFRYGEHLLVLVKPVIRVPKSLMGHVIGKGGSRVREISQMAGFPVKIKEKEE